MTAHALFNTADVPEASGRIAAYRTSVGAARTDIAIDLLGDDRSLKSARGEGRTALSAGLDALSRAYDTQASVADCEITQAGSGFDGSAFAEVSLNIKGEVYRGRGRGPDPVWAGLRALCAAFEKSTFVTRPIGSTEVPAETISKS